LERNDIRDKEERSDQKIEHLTRMFGCCEMYQIGEVVEKYWKKAREDS